MKTLRSIVLLGAVGFVVSTQLGSGCKSDSDRDRYPRDPGPYRNDPYNQPDPYSYPEPYHGPRDYRWDTVPLPREAELVAEGRDEIRFRARNDGRIFLYDADDRVVIDDRALFRNEEYIVSPKDDRGWVNKDRVLEYDFPEHHTYRLYFVARGYDIRDRDNDRRRDADRESIRQEAVRKRQSQYNPQAGNSQGGHGARDYRWDTVALPQGATLAGEGRESLRFTARNDGRVYLYDVDDNFVIDDRTLLHREEYIVSPKDNRAWINKDRVLDYDFDEHHAYRLYFVEHNPAPQDRDNDRRRDAARDAARQEAVHKRPPANNPNAHEVDKHAQARRVPDTAKLIASGKGDDLSYRATGDGTVYLYDNDHAALIEIFTMKRGQRLTVSPAHDSATLDGRVVMNRKDLNPKTNYRLLFDAKP